MWRDDGRQPPPGWVPDEQQVHINNEGSCTGCLLYTLCGLMVMALIVAGAIQLVKAIME